MGSVGSGVAGEQEFAMKSVGTRTTLPRGPVTSRRGPCDRSLSAERLHAAPSASEGSSEERGGTGTSANTDRAQINMGTSHMERISNFPEMGRRDGHFRSNGGGVMVDVCGNVVVEKSNEGVSSGKSRDNGKRDSRTPPKILSVSGKLEQNSSALVRPSAFKPVVPKSFHSMQNLLAQSGGRSDGPQSLSEQDSPDRAPSGETEPQPGLSDSGRNSLTSLPTFPVPGLGFGPGQTLSASTSHINRLSSTGAPADPSQKSQKSDRPGYQNGLSVSDSGQSSSGKSCVSFQRLCQMSDPNAALVQASPSTEDIIQDLEDRLWEKEQEVIHMRRNLDQSEAAIVQVFEEKQRVCEREMEDLRQSCAARLTHLTHRAQRSQQSLQTHVGRLTQDKARLQDEMAALLTHRDELQRKCLDFRREQADILPRLEETKWELCQKAGEISLLKQQLRESQAEVTQRAGETVALRGQIKELHSQLKEREEAMIGLKESYSSKSRELERCEGELKRTLSEVSMLREQLVLFEAEVLGLKRALSDLSCRSDLSASPWAALHSPRTPEPLPSLSLTPLSVDELLSLQSDEAKAQRQEAGELRRQLERLQGELHLEKQQRERQALTFAQERHTWQDEKERVLKYQAQLQISYVQTLQRNQALEERVKLASRPGSPPDESEAPTLHQLAPPWPGPSRLERIESTEI